MRGGDRVDVDVFGVALQQRDLMAVDELADAGYPDTTLAVLVDLGATGALAADRPVTRA